MILFNRIQSPRIKNAFPSCRPLKNLTVRGALRISSDIDVSNSLGIHNNKDLNG